MKSRGREEVRTCESAREVKSDIKLYILVYMCKTHTYYDSCSTCRHAVIADNMLGILG